MVFRQVREHKKKGKKSVLYVTLTNDGEFLPRDWVNIEKVENENRE